MTNEDWDLCAETVKPILYRIQQTAKKGAGSDAWELLWRRIINSVNSLRVLNEHAPHDCALDSETILRAIFDAHVQARYIFCDPAKTDERGTLYVEFAHVEKWKITETIDSSSTAFAKEVAADPLYIANRAGILAAFNRVKAKYPKPDGKGVRHHWYPGSLREIAAGISSALRDEYDLLLRGLHEATHSSPVALGKCVKSPKTTLHAGGWLCAIRVLNCVLQHHSIELADEKEKKLIEIFSKPFFS